MNPPPMSFTTSPSVSWKSVDAVSDQFPAGLRVLVVDDDPTCLRILEKMLRNCLYEVTKCSRAEVALKLLRDNKDGFDVVISDVHMPDMDGFKLLEHIGLEMDLPVIMMSADDSKSVVMKGVTHGACDYLIKPVRMEALKNIWQHVVRKTKHEWKEKDLEHSGSVEDGERNQRPNEDVDYSSSANEGNWKSSKRRKDEDDEAEERDDTSTMKKPRVVWSSELHQQFVTAVNQLGIDKAVPKKILELMNVPGLTRENVASHLQKYRLYLRRLSGQHQNGLGNSFMGPTDASFGSISPLNGLDLQALAASGQISPHSLATIQVAPLNRPTTTKSPISVPSLDQRNIFSFENPKIRFLEGQQQHNNSSNNNQVNLLHGIPTNMDSKQLTTLHQSPQPYSNMNMHVHTQGIPSAVLARNGIENVRGPTSVVDFSRGQPGNSSFSLVGNSGISSLASKGTIQEGFNMETKGSRGFVPNYDVFSELNQNRSDDWGLHNVGSTLNPNVQGGLDVGPSVLVQPGFSSFKQKSALGNNTNIGQQLNSSLNDNSLRIKAERLPNMGFHQNGLFNDHFGQEDLMSALLKQQQEGLGSVETEFGFDGYNLDNLPV
ncbi:hypothetical protein BUALT_Bualt12G0116400 [Buddleja alternifolia]|uniref:Two-component response regulator n=1 Tax=Buddleja alternifolia TaxID=168488 RepID=A0AAV6WWR7_9LAMI|nr:hypothetical protein BUALT_Bualt12G0116400 [Buddleja alternifolia]